MKIYISCVYVVRKGFIKILKFFGFHNVTSYTCNICIHRSLIKAKIMPALVESEEEETEDTDSKDPLPEKLQNSMVTGH